MSPPRAPSPQPPLRWRTHAATVSRQLPGTFVLFWRAWPAGALGLGLLTLVAALLPAAIAWVAKLIIDGIVQSAGNDDPAAERHVLMLVGLEFGLMAASTAATRSTSLVRELMRARLGNTINELILEKALGLELRHFEDSELYDKMQNARREAGGRPLSLVLQGFTIVQNTITLATFAALLFRLGAWAVLVLVAASIPAFIAEAKMANASFRLNSWRAPEGRRLNYLEWILTRDSHVKEVKLFGIGQLILGRYRSLFAKFFAEDRALAIRRMVLGLTLGLLSLAAFYAIYLYVARQAVRAELTLGDMTLYLMVFRQGQTALQAMLTAIGSMYEDSLFMSNLFLYLEVPSGGEAPRVLPPKAPPRGRRINALELENVSFRYPGRDAWALRDVTLRIEPGEKLGLVGENGAGKSTLIKLLLRFYTPTEGAIRYGGVDLRDMDADELRSRIGAVFQDFVRYQFSAAENIGLGNVHHLEDRPRIQRAAEDGGALSVVESLPQGFDTVLGGWFEKGQELSSGQWQKLAVARAFMRDAELLLFDEPTAAIDAEAEHELFQRFKRLAEDRTALIISHRFSTVRVADRIAVLHEGRLEEFGSHEDLMARNGRYAHLFSLQAAGYR